MLIVYQFDWDRMSNLRLKEDAGREELTDAERSELEDLINLSFGHRELDEMEQIVQRTLQRGGYKPVAMMPHASNPEIAWMQTNTVRKPWWENTDVTPLFDGDGCRSTSIGDIVVSNGVVYIAATFGFNVISSEVVEHELEGLQNEHAS